MAAPAAVFAKHDRAQGDEEQNEPQEEQEVEEKEAEVQGEGEEREDQQAEDEEEGREDKRLGAQNDEHMEKKHRKGKRKHHRHKHDHKRRHKHRKQAVATPEEGEEVLPEGEESQDATPSLPVDYVVGKCIACGKRWEMGATASGFRFHLQRNKSCLAIRNMTLSDPLPVQWPTLAMSMDDALEEETAAKAQAEAQEVCLRMCACGEQLSSTASSSALKQHEESKAHMKYLKSRKAMQEMPSPRGQQLMTKWCAAQSSPSAPAHLPSDEDVEGQVSPSESPLLELELPSHPLAEASHATYHPCPAVLPLSCTSREQFVQNYPIYVHTLQPPRQWHVAARLDGVHANSCAGVVIMSGTQPQPCTKCASIRNPSTPLP